MAFVNYNSYRSFGGASDSDGRHNGTVSNQTVGEAIAVGNVSRKFHGPAINGHFSLHGAVTSAFGAGSTLTIAYSNLYDPDVTNDAHWVQDASISAVDLTSTTPFFLNVGNVYADWVRIKVNSATSGGSLYVFVRSEGEQKR